MPFYTIKKLSMRADLEVLEHLKQRIDYRYSLKSGDMGLPSKLFQETFNITEFLEYLSARCMRKSSSQETRVVQASRC